MWNGNFCSVSTQTPISIENEKNIDPDTLGVGFKVFKLDTSNIKKWNPDYDNLEQSLFDTINSFVPKRSNLDIVYEIMIKYGLDLTYPVEEITLDNNKKIYSVAFGMLVICLDDEVTTDIANNIVAYKNENNIEQIRVVFKDNGFKTDTIKSNVKEILKCGGVNEFITI